MRNIHSPPKVIFTLCNIFYIPKNMTSYHKVKESEYFLKMKCPSEISLYPDIMNTFIEMKKPIFRPEMACLGTHPKSQLIGGTLAPLVVILIRHLALKLGFLMLSRRTLAPLVVKLVHLKAPKVFALFLIKMSVHAKMCCVPKMENVMGMV